MNLEIGNTLTTTKLNKFELLTTFGSYRIFLLNQDPLFIIAVDPANLICGCFDFPETEEGIQLAHMYVLGHLKGQRIGTAILTEAVNLWTVFILPSTNKNDTYYFIGNGYGFIQSCFDRGVLTEPPFKRPE